MTLFLIVTSSSLYLYISHLISPTRVLLSVKWLKSVEEVKRQVSYGAMVLCGVCCLHL